MKTPVIEKIPHNVLFGNVQGVNRGSANLMDPPVTLIDNYNWIRDDTKQSDLILKRIQEENDYFDSKFKNKEKFSKNLYSELLMLMKEDYDTYPKALYSGSKWKYFSRYNNGSDYVQHWRTNQADMEGENKERIDQLLLDENTLVKPEKELDVTEFYLNPSEKFISYGFQKVKIHKDEFLGHSINDEECKLFTQFLGSLMI
jgi:protease II